MTPHLSTQIPVNARRLLPDLSPGHGGATASRALAHALERQLTATQHSFARAHSARHELSAQHSDRVAHLHDTVIGSFLPGLRTLASTAHQAAQGFTRYADRVEELAQGAIRAEERVASQLSRIRSQSHSIQEIAARTGVRVAYPWDSGAPPWMPEPGPDHPFADAFAGLPEAQRTALLRHQRVTEEPLWQHASAHWQQALQAIAEERASWHRLLRAREQAEEELITALTQTGVGQLLAVAAGGSLSLAHAVAGPLSGQLWGRPYEFMSTAVAHPLLTKLLGADSPAPGADTLDRHAPDLTTVPGFPGPSLTQLWQQPGNPDAVAAGWAALSAAERATLLREVPRALGNLPGLPFAVRHQANLRVLQFAVVHQEELSAASKAAVRDITGILAKDGAGFPCTLVALNVEGEVPLVALGRGPLDTATSLTWQVPGMFSDAHHAISPWDTASKNLLGEQRRLLAPLANPPQQSAVISFLSYDTPDLLTVLGPGAARAGAPRLTAEIDGTRAARAHGVPLPNLSVLAHSYGTTLAANALLDVRHPVQSFTLLGSAGLDSFRVQQLRSLRVEPDRAGVPRIYSTVSSSDLLAPLGATVSLRLQPDPTAAAVLVVNGPSATGFASQGTSRLNPTRGHHILNDSGRGYLDRGTQSLRNVAALTLGIPEARSGSFIAPKTGSERWPDPRTITH